MRADHPSRLQFFPITYFAVIMGLSGLTIALSKFYHLGWLPEWPYLLILFGTSALFLVFLAGYLLKLALYPDEVRKDYHHKTRMNFVPTISISLLLLSIAYLGFWPLLSVPLWFTGVVLHTVLMFHTLSKWVHHEFDIQHFNPAWFIPVVGNILVPVVGVMCAPPAVSAFFLVSGLFFWVILSTIIIYRLIFHKSLPQKLMPTLFIFLAPPAVGFISYMRLTMSYDLVSRSLLLLAYFIFILLLFLFRAYKDTPFFLSWWAYTFPLGAFSIASTVAYQITRHPAYQYIAWFGLVLLVVVIAIVSYHTFTRVMNRSICVEEE